LKLATDNWQLKFLASWFRGREGKVQPERIFSHPLHWINGAGYGKEILSDPAKAQAKAAAKDASQPRR
jgi:hypothetical protein